MAWLVARLPAAPVSPKRDRSSLDKAKALRGIFWILDNGAKWKNLTREFGSKSAVHRYFQCWVWADMFERILRDTGCVVEDPEDALNHLALVRRRASAFRRQFMIRQPFR